MNRIMEEQQERVSGSGGEGSGGEGSGGGGAGGAGGAGGGAGAGGAGGGQLYKEAAEATKTTEEGKEEVSTKKKEEAAAEEQGARKALKRRMEEGEEEERGACRGLMAGPASVPSLPVAGLGLQQNVMQEDQNKEASVSGSRRHSLWFMDNKGNQYEAQPGSWCYVDDDKLYQQALRVHVPIYLDEMAQWREAGGR